MAAEDKAVYVVTGASRGLGLEFVKQILGTGNKVIAAIRNPTKAEALNKLAAEYPGALSLVPLDVSDTASIQAVADAVAAVAPNGVDILINNAGIIGAVTLARHEDVNEFQKVLTTNVLGPFLLVKSLLPLVQKGKKKQIVQISSEWGSMGMVVEAVKMDEPPAYARSALAYRVSKAALNMETALLAVDLKVDGMTIVSLNPGWVATDMGSYGATTLGAPPPKLDAPTSVGGMLKVIAGLTPEQSGRLINHTGEVLPY